MSKIMIETRMCDSCDATKDSSPFPAWMTLTFPNVEGEDTPEFDFCTYECLAAWVNEDTGMDEPEATLDSHDAVVAALAQQGPTNIEMPQPIMSLAQAIASGQLKPSNPV